MKRTRTEELILLRGILADGAVAAFADAAEKASTARFAQAYALLLESGEENAFARHMVRAILYDDNLFARRAFGGGLTENIRAAYRRDLALLQQFTRMADGFSPAEGMPRILYGEDNPLFGENWDSEQALSRIEDFYRRNGYGIFIGNKAFTYENGALRPVKNTSDIALSDLKDYAEEKRAVEDNAVSFLRGLPYSDMLLYGDKGTGKSSTVHAVLNKYAEQGLRAVEIAKEQIRDINAIKELLASLPFRFFLFIDDLSLEEHDEKVGLLKASLEGSMNEKSPNVMIVATSNRRHILKENFSDRENSVHARDTMEEQLSLSDRFGLTVYFSSTGKAEYLSIVRQLAEDRKLGLPDEELCALAERWAIVKGGRSPRRAKQFVDYACSCLSKNSPIDI